MKKIPLVFALTLLACAQAAAQSNSTSYRFDNFDVKDGVRVVLPPAPAAKRPRRVKLTARSIAPERPASSDVAGPTYRPPAAVPMAV
ncbi:MAG TPA: hypothetical protein VE642_10015, partial [Pyrinomonadaceae bacterium]|nr:hypothetical protein [Pyrinomonadaceae bacterium]